MSRLVRFTTEGEEAITTAAETLLQVRGVTTSKWEVAELSVSADYETDGTEIVLWDLLYQTTDGTATGGTEVPGDPDDPTPAITVFNSFTAEPTAGSVICSGHFNANGGEAVRYWADGDGPAIDNATSSRIGLRVTSTIACNAQASMALRVVAA